MRKYSLVFIVFMYVFLGYGQDLNLNASYPQVSKPEASVSSLMKFEEIPVSNYTGVPEISVPIYSLPTRSKDISLNVALGYHPSSVAMDDVAGQCGTGWSLFSGGLITRDVIGKPDEFSNGYAQTNENDIYQFSFMGKIGRFYLNKNAQGVLNVRILENIDEKLVIVVNYNLSTYSINSFTVYDNKGYKYLFQDFDTQTYYNQNSPVNSYKSTFHLTKVTDNNNRDLVNYTYDTYTQVVNSSYTNLFKKCKDVMSIGYGKVNFIYSSGSNMTYSTNIKITRLDLVDLTGLVLKKHKFIYNSNNLFKIENCNFSETIKETYEFVYKGYSNPPDGFFVIDDWGYRKFIPNCLYSYPIESVNNNVTTKYCDLGVLSEIYLPTGGTISYKYESNTYSLYSRDLNGQWQLDDQPDNYVSDDMPENYLVSTVVDYEFLGNGTNSYSFTVPGTGTTPIAYYFNVTPTPYTIENIDPEGTLFYPSFLLSGNGITSLFIFDTSNFENLCQGQAVYLLPGQTYTITIGANKNSNKKGKFHVSKRDIKPVINKNLHGAGIRINTISYFDKKVSDYYSNIPYYNSLSVFPAKQKSYSYNFFQTSRSSGAVVYPGYDSATNSRIKREPVGYKNVTVTETGKGREEFTYTSPMDLTPPPISGALNTIYYDYRRGLLTNLKTFGEPSILFADIDMTYEFVETPNSTVIFDNPALNERLGWAKLTGRVSKNFFANSVLPQIVTESFTYNDAIRKISSKTTTNSLGETLKTQFTYHTGNSTFSQNRIAEIDKVESYRGTELLFSKKVLYSNVWNGNVSFLPNIVQGAKSTQTLVNSYRISNYDEFSNPIETMQENGIFVSYIWGYNKTKLVAKIENATNAQVASALGLGNITLATENNLVAINALRTNALFVNAMITTYTYIPLVGVSTVTDPKGDRLTYEYDNFYRLKAVRDKNNKILTETLYYQAVNAQDINAVTNLIYKTESTTFLTSPTIANALQTKTFIDGLGRPVQQIDHQQSNITTDIVTHIEYDDQGRIAKSYLPYANSTASLNYNPNAKTELLNYTGYVGQNPYVQKLFEKSPFDRVIEQAAPGSDWSIDSAVKHTIRFDYQTNQANDNVRRFTATSNIVSNSITLANTATGIFYPPNELIKTVVKNENWKIGDGNNNITETFKDKEGRVVMSRVFSNSIVNGVSTGTWHETYTVYDQYGNVTFVIPPKADGAITPTVIEDLCYQYKYDFRNRLIEKKIPGKQWEYIVYDKLNRVVASGPALSPFTDNSGVFGWLLVKYDALNRSILTAWTSTTAATAAGRSTLQGAYNNATVLSETKSTSTSSVSSVAYNYTNVAFPTGGYHVLTVNYYDNYSTNLTFLPAIGYTSSVTPQPVFYNNTAATMPRGLPTISWVRVPETTTLYKAEKSYVLYDEKARVVRLFSNNYLDGFSQVDSQLQPITGRVNFTLTTHKRLPASPTITIRDNYTYTPQDRLLTHTHEIVGSSNGAQLLKKNDYNNLGQLITKRVGGSSLTGATSWQKIDYAYNIRGWLLSINNSANNNLDLNVAENDLFAFKINYNTIQTTSIANGQ
ncbi:DUF6443 domain-containing protein [Flavobacterium sp. j3]|uniref:DUF6443 domain-containing protein n=1 Tax=Flavobacterium aureirubrum TaxID=3133147 RepID=A0ABU9N8J8_9FLAO